MQLLNVRDLFHTGRICRDCSLFFMVFLGFRDVLTKKQAAIYAAAVIFKSYNKIHPAFSP